MPHRYRFLEVVVAASAAVTLGVLLLTETHNVPRLAAWLMVVLGGCIFLEFFGYHFARVFWRGVLRLALSFVKPRSRWFGALLSLDSELHEILHKLRGAQASGAFWVSRSEALPNQQWKTVRDVLAYRKWDTIHGTAEMIYASCDGLNRAVYERGWGCKAQRTDRVPDLIRSIEGLVHAIDAALPEAERIVDRWVWVRRLAGEI
jgi:hypothetical protein